MRALTSIWLVPLGALAIVAGSLVVVSYALMAGDSPTAATHHLGDVCLQLVSHAPLHWSAWVVLGVLGTFLLAGTVNAVWRARQRLRGQRRFLRLIEHHQARQPAGNPAHITFTSHTPHAFTAGLRRPCVYMSTGLRDLLTHEEYEAVLAHEEAHRRRHDPLRKFCLLAVADLFFFLPLVRGAITQLLAGHELAADAAVWAAVPARRRHLASALARLLDVGSPSFAAGFGSSDAYLWDLRVDAITTGRTPRLHLRTRQWLTSAAVLLLPLALLGMSTHVLAGVETVLSCGHLA